MIELGMKQGVVIDEFSDEELDPTGPNVPERFRVHHRPTEEDFMLLRVGFALAGFLVVTQSANAQVYCKTVGIPTGCVMQPGHDAGAPGVGVAPGAGAGAPGVGVMRGAGVGTPGVGIAADAGAPGAGVNRGGPANRPGLR